MRLGQVAGPLTYPLMSRLLSPAFRNIYNCIHTSADGRDNSPVTSVDGIGGSRGLISSTAVDGSKETHAAVRRHAPASVRQTSARWKLHTRPVSHSVVLLSAKQTRATATAFLTCRKPISQQSHDRTKKKPTAGCCTGSSVQSCRWRWCGWMMTGQFICCLSAIESDRWSE